MVIPHTGSLGAQYRHLADRVWVESIRLWCPDFADVPRQYLLFSGANLFVALVIRPTFSGLGASGRSGVVQIAVTEDVVSI